MQYVIFLFYWLPDTAHKYFSKTCQLTLGIFCPLTFLSNFLTQLFHCVFINWSKPWPFYTGSNVTTIFTKGIKEGTILGDICTKNIALYTFPTECNFAASNGKSFHMAKYKTSNLWIHARKEYLISQHFTNERTTSIVHRTINFPEMFFKLQFYC